MALKVRNTIVAALVGILASLAGAQPVVPLIAPPWGSDFPACVGQLRSTLTAQGIRERVFDEALRGVEPDPTIPELMARQPEFQVPIWDYLSGAVDERRIADGKSQMVRWAKLLRAVEKKYGVDRHVVVAIWGIETNYGKITGKRPLVRSLATGSCYGHRKDFFRSELRAVLEILQRGDIDPSHLKGSWAGAFGQVQFMPSTWRRVAVDFDGDKRRDIVDSVPDALASAARYLQLAGWDDASPWGYEVTLPTEYEGPSGRRVKESLDGWRRRGLKRVDGLALKGDTRAALLLPAGLRGPAFLALPNFEAIISYNASVSYALSIAHLADRMRGGKPFFAAWPTDDPGLSRAERQEVQERLLNRGYEVGEPDGIIGSRTRDAIESFQRASGLQPDGYAGARLLNALRSRPYLD